MNKELETLDGLDELARAAKWFYEEREESIRLKEEIEELSKEIDKLYKKKQEKQDRLDLIYFTDGGSRHRLMNAAINYAKRNTGNEQMEVSE